MTNMDLYDCIMIGAGPASLTAAIYTTREGIKTLLIEKGAIGGLAATTDFIENYPGFPEGISGMELAEKFRAQATRFGAEFELGEVQSISREGKDIKVVTESKTLRAKSVLISTGSDYKKLGIKGDDEFFGRGVSYCATCDGPLFKDKKVVVVGGGNSAMQESLFMTRFTSDITLLVRGDKFTGSEILIKRVEESPIKVEFNFTTQEITSEGNKLTGIKGINNLTQAVTEFPADGVFVFIGLTPNSGFLKNTEIELNEYGFIKASVHLETAMPGVFVAGDVRAGANMQVVSAAGEGATAAKSIREYLEKL